MRKSISALQAYVDYMTATKEYAVQSEKTIKNLQSCVESLKTTNREMKAQLDIATDLGDKRWKECEKLRNELSTLKDAFTACDNELSAIKEEDGYNARQLLLLRINHQELTAEVERLRKALESLKSTDRFDPHVMTYLIPMIDVALRGEE